ncbi:hypothetical protein KCU95_g10683, partial [Aureobasidium melanogenum]
LLRSARSSSAQDFRRKKAIPIAEDIWTIVQRDPPSFHVEVQRYIDQHTPEEFVDDVIRGTPNPLLIQLEQTAVDMDKLAEGRASDADPELRTASRDRGTYLVWARPKSHIHTTLHATLTSKRGDSRPGKKAAFYAGKGSSGQYGIQSRATSYVHADAEMTIHRLIRDNDLGPTVLVS